MSTNIEHVISDLDGGVLAEKLSHAISKVAAGVIDYDKTGSVTLSLKFKRTGSSYQVNIEHALTYQAPTAKGHSSEKIPPAPLCMLAKAESFSVPRKSNANV